jgi:uncharacterized protein (DUF1330 family)
MGVDLLNVKGLQALDPHAPVVMVNLMRFRERSLDGDGSGWDAYLRYSALTVPMIKARGGTLLWTGDATAVALGQQDGNQWDYLALVYYPTVAAFIDMMTSQDYEQRCDPHRTNGCAEHVIIATKEAYSKFKDPVARMERSAIRGGLTTCAKVPGLRCAPSGLRQRLKTSAPNPA